MIRCGECGSSITAEEKIKRQQNGNVHHYTYYHCTRSQNSNCSQKCVEEKEISRQIQAKIDRIAIHTEFTEWALDLYKKENKKEAGNITKIIDNIQNTYKTFIH